jgi:hypothetical protein
MKRWPVWACGGIVVFGILARLVLGGNTSAARSDGKTQNATVSPVTSTPAAGSSESSAPYSPATLRRLANDTLPPPPEDASPREKAEYVRALKEIQDGRDPMVQAFTPKKEKLEDNRKRIQERQEAARKRAAEQRLAFDLQLKAAHHSQRERLRNAGLNPDAPPPPPLFPTPQLGEAIIDYDKPAEKK